MVRNMGTKEDIRKQILAVRAGISKAERRAAEAAIAERLMQTDFYKNARCIYCYASFRDEAGTAQIIEGSLRQGKRVAAPRVVSGRQERNGILFHKEPGGLKTGSVEYPGARAVVRKGASAG